MAFLLVAQKGVYEEPHCSKGLFSSNPCLPILRGVVTSVGRSSILTYVTHFPGNKNIPRTTSRRRALVSRWRSSCSERLRVRLTDRP